PTTFLMMRERPPAPTTFLTMRQPRPSNRRPPGS
ncbi:uncharacterized protein METZ01_LOCUS113644, partial [marine metagenome]